MHRKGTGRRGDHGIVPRFARRAFAVAFTSAALFLVGSSARNDAVDELPVSSIANIATAPAGPATTQREDRLAQPTLVARIDTSFASIVIAGKQPRLSGGKQPRLAHVLQPYPMANPARFAARVPPPQPAPQIAAGPLSRFYAKLAALESGERTEPVTILHIGDSHVAADSFTRGIRARLQERFGDAGRGAVIPAGAFAYAHAEQVSLQKSGPWDAASSLKDKSGPYGLSGVRLTSSSADASITLTARTGSFDWAAVTVAGGRGAGSFEVSVDGRPTLFSARPGVPSTTVRVSGKGTTLTVRPIGDGRVTVLDWATGKERPGIRYVNFGIVGATVDVTRRWNPAIVANDLKELKPDLIVYGYGTNEGFDDNIDPHGYAAYAKRWIASLRADAPQADVMFVGAADGARRGRGKGCDGGWSTPVKLDTLRAMIRQVAAENGAGYWSWADAMGGRCGIDNWVAGGLAAKDHVHMTPAGYDRTAAAFVDYLLRPLDKAVPVAMNQ
jgi:lysophospholipase L1-like esterase